MKKIFVGILLGAALFLGACASDSIEKVQDNLGFLEDAQGEIVLALNTEVTMTTVRESAREAMLDEAKEQIAYYHKLIDAHRDYVDADGKPVVNVKYLNDHAGEGPIEVDGALLDCLDEAITMAELTQGYFNPTIGAVSDVYEGRFEQSGEVQQGPSAEALEAARKTIVPYAQLRDYIVLDQDAHTVDLRPYEGGQYRLSLSAIGKGYALAHLGFSRDSSYLINAGTSSMRGHLGEEEAHEREPISWNIATHVPDGTDILFAFKLGEASVSVSGDDENYYLLEDGTRVHHILNPFTGTSENYWRNVVLVGEDAGVLDALSTALFNIEDEQLVKEIIRDVEQSYGMTIDYCFVREEDAGTFQLRGSQSFLERILPDYNKGELNPRMFIMDEEGNEAWQSM